MRYDNYIETELVKGMLDGWMENYTQWVSF